jgi:hypothetical protein
VNHANLERAAALPVMPEARQHNSGIGCLMPFRKNLSNPDWQAFASLPKPCSLKQLIEAVKQVKT